METAQQDWVDSPASGVRRKLLEREEAERGRATSIVEYKPGASFNTHEHPLGEEILVLEGVFSDEYGDYPAGTWMRSPHMSVHHPFVDEETVIWVKTGHLPT